MRTTTVFAAALFAMSMASGPAFGQAAQKPGTPNAARGTPDQSWKQVDEINRETDRIRSKEGITTRPSGPVNTPSVSSSSPTLKSKRVGTATRARGYKGKQKTTTK